jgi:hypothetical protein
VIDQGDTAIELAERELHFVVQASGRDTTRNQRRVSRRGPVRRTRLRGSLAMHIGPTIIVKRTLSPEATRYNPNEPLHSRSRILLSLERFRDILMYDGQTEGISGESKRFCFHLMSRKTFMPRRHPSDDAWSYFANASVFRNLTNRTEKGYSRPDGSGRSRTQDVRTTRVLLRAGLGLALPDTDGGSSDGDLATGGTGVLGVLGDFHLLDAIREEARGQMGTWGMWEGTYVFLNEAPYRTPYFPVIPTFLVRLV